jgi:hypothetical protein
MIQIEAFFYLCRTIKFCAVQHKIRFSCKQALKLIATYANKTQLKWKSQHAFIPQSNFKLQKF